ncbi:hypothetical protein [Pseudomarimonas salicorniae]|uniref:Laminin IV type A domain-containing protein n=1 Tax=Pseudomarimonas salicorniae TaxID=2933270 RepID=A0ABT0GNG4_9GAMM|nr:hypothetical protein [Lysobacter sp. CAU 1642]MCK7595542.1 hypothetical protein [Lysobacter sp. CAU 1642]
MLLRLSLLCLLAVLGSTSARAYTPESGVWWNPNEPGTGIFIEIQDNFLVAAAYTYDSAGNAQWYTATGFMSGNARFDGVLDAFTNGNCPGCPYRPNREFLGAGGPITIIFDPNDTTRASLRWGGRTMPIERFQFYLKRPEDQQALPGVRIELTKMLGEWQMVLDFADNPNADFRFFGDITVLDVLDSDSQGDFLEGCRPADSLRGFCSNSDVRDHRATLEFVPSSREQVMVVDNDSQTFAAYFLTTGTNFFQGEVSVYLKGSNPTVFYPVRGFRSASRSFVQEGIGPSKGVAKAPAALPLAWFSSEGAVEKSLSAERTAALRAAEARLESTKAKHRKH